MSEFIEQLNRVYETSDKFINGSAARADALIKAGDANGARDVMLNMLNGIEAKNKIVNSAMQQRNDMARQILYTPLHPSTSSLPTKKLPTELPAGMSKGKIAAIVATVAVVGGSILLYQNAQKKKQQPWAERIGQERTTSLRSGVSI